MIYLDWNATTPPTQGVLDAMHSATADGWANPASVHGAGRQARAHVERARAAVAHLLGFDIRDVVLTSGGTEANNLALRAVLTSADAALVVSVIEHPSVVRVAEALEQEGREVIWVEPTAAGVVPCERIARALDRLGGRPKLVTLQAVNHETGVLQPVAEVAALARARGTTFHCDAVQAIGKLPSSAWSGADLVSLAAHKLRGPKGIGALAHRAGLKIRPVLLGGGQERGARPGTQDPIACAGLAEAARQAADGPTRYAQLASFRDRLESAETERDPPSASAWAKARRRPRLTQPSRHFRGCCGAPDPMRGGTVTNHLRSPGHRLIQTWDFICKSATGFTISAIDRARTAIHSMDPEPSQTGHLSRPRRMPRTEP